MTIFRSVPKKGIYALADPIAHRVMYVGQSMDIDFRYRQHCGADWSSSNLQKSEWLGRLRRQNLEPELIELEECDSFFELDAAEKKWIREYKVRGEAELNIASGGISRSASRSMNVNREEWFQLARKVRDVRELLLDVANDAGRMASAKHMDAVRNVVSKLDREVVRLEKHVMAEFPEWDEVSRALLSTRNPAV
jgi:hypothetical protein